MIHLLPNTYRAFYGSFQQLHPIQQQAIEPILAQKDLILQSATGSGKTEAVLAPCMERVICSRANESILYIVPTRALAADLYRRFKTIITERLGLGFAIRTGDLKQRGGGHPALMLTTPESLDVMLGSSNQDLRGFLARVRIVIIDEAHSFIHQYRGQQLVYLLQRLERRISRRVQRIALSATLADSEEVGRFLGCSPDTVSLADKVSRDIVPRLVHLQDDEQELIGLLDDLYREWEYCKILLFANSRGRCDKIFGLVNRLGSFKGKAHLHYSNLTSQQRQQVERSFRKQSRSICIATSTLELGIDVGDVDAVLLFEPPDSVAAFLQRIGRANRRQKAIHFWGICRGEQAGQQVLRFLALLSLARQGQVEAALPKNFPSVLSQQVISCLYEKKRLSLQAVQELFCDPGVDSGNEEAATRLENIFQSLIKKQWLRKDKLEGLYTGGWRYWDALVEQRIWSNFPETEIEYKLDVAGEPVADIPQTIVKQLDPGDKVLLAGRPLRILWINTKADKRVFAEPTQERLDNKELLWLGMGCHTSLETAQAMRAVLKSTDKADNTEADGLFSRTKKLIHEQMARDAKAVLLANGIEVALTETGSFQYRTYLGSVGNMLLAWSVKEYLAAQSEDIEVDSDEIGLICSQWIPFEKLRLPLQRDDFTAWVKRHFKQLRAMFPLNAFCATLPLEILRHELVDCIFDQRLIAFFQQYKDSSSEIVQGDPRNLEFHPEQAEEQASTFFEVQSQPLLALEKNRHGNAEAAASVFITGKEVRYRNRPLTGTMIGEYFRHHQCGRQFCASFLQPEDQPPRQSPLDDEYASLRLARGLAFEQEIMDELAGFKEQFHSISKEDQDRRPCSLEARCAETREYLHRICEQKDIAGKLYLAQGVFRLPALLSLLPESSELFGLTGKEQAVLPGVTVDGVGIPDLIRIAVEGPNILLEVGDIKSVAKPRYHQKWQVAFYAFLLKTFLEQERLDTKGVQVADSGFLLIRSPLDDKPQRHTFALQPYLASLPALLRNFAQCLSHPPDQAGWQLQAHCLSCPYFEHCYQQALHEEDIQFIPRLSQGALEKMRGLGLRNIEEASDCFADGFVGTRRAVPLRAGQAQGPAPTTCIVNTDFSPAQREGLHNAVTALHENKIILTRQRTELFPAHIATCFFVHLLNDPVTMLPKALGLGVGQRGQGAEDLQIFTWVAADTSAQAERQKTWQDVWRDFSGCFLDLWQEAIEKQGRPHIFFFGTGIRQGLDEWAAMMADKPLRSLFRRSLEPSYPVWTDLQQVLHRHFALPIPATLTLYDLARVLGLSRGTTCRVPTLPVPESLVHFDPLPDTVGAVPVCPPFSDNTSQGRHIGLPLLQAEEHLAAVLNIDSQLQQWLTSHLSSDWSRESRDAGDNLDGPTQSGLRRGLAYQRFLEAERAVQKKDIRELQELSLAERVERFRALGPLHFTGTGLDDEGRFLYLFEVIEESDGAGTRVSKFRQGDFLKLVPQGVKDLQSGMPVIVDSYEPQQGSIALSSRQRGTLHLQKNLAYSLEEDADDWTTPKLIEVVQSVYSDKIHHPLVDLFDGAWDFTQPSDWQEWVQEWLHTEGKLASLNASQEQGLQMPFRHALSLIQGPPGTGKTNLLGWILIALIRHAQARDEPLRIAISALTHQAIDQVLSKVVKLVNQHDLPDFPGHCCKWGRWDGPDFAENSDEMQVEPLEAPEQVLRFSHLILGATGYGLTNLIEKNKTLPSKPFDWVIFDEASQVLLPQAMLSLVHGKGNFLFLGDVQQLPPVIRSAPLEQETDDFLDQQADDTHGENLGSEVRRSLLTLMLHRYPQQSVFLDLTYRMNAEICAFPSRTWYDSQLRPAPANAAARLSIKGRLGNDPLDKIIAPEKPVVLVRANHHGCGQESIVEAEIMARLAHRLQNKYRLDKEQLALISPHRAQNNRISRSLAELLGNSDDLPLIDTVERIQGAEREAILFGFTCSDPDQVLSEFLNNPNRFNVAITRARHKLIVVGSETFFTAVAHNEESLRANVCFKEFFARHPSIDGADIFR
ncbi:MAG: DEAD/DEAH box helicase [Candidatus Electrothrix sp. GW3-4]|uniref:DEAD/DEAH box helicase n=1 Tax=Candidatus Electrothrix sp. GW3-4 TaxID=3126740 RepID=UPI0030D1D14F